MQRMADSRSNHERQARELPALSETEAEELWAASAIYGQPAARRLGMLLLDAGTALRRKVKPWETASWWQGFLCKNGSSPTRQGQVAFGAADEGGLIDRAGFRRALKDILKLRGAEKSAAGELSDKECHAFFDLLLAMRGRQPNATGGTTSAREASSSGMGDGLSVSSLLAFLRTMTEDARVAVPGSMQQKAARAKRSAEQLAGKAAAEREAAQRAAAEREAHERVAELEQQAAERKAEAAAAKKGRPSATGGRAQPGHGAGDAGSGRDAAGENGEDGRGRRGRARGVGGGRMRLRGGDEGDGSDAGDSHAGGLAGGGGGGDGGGGGGGDEGGPLGEWMVMEKREANKWAFPSGTAARRWFAAPSNVRSSLAATASAAGGRWGPGRRGAHAAAEEDERRSRRWEQSTSMGGGSQRRGGIESDRNASAGQGARADSMLGLAGSGRIYGTRNHWRLPSQAVDVVAHFKHAALGPLEA